MEKVEIYCWSSDGGKYLFRGGSFEEELLKEFQDLGERGFCKKDKWYITLCEHLKTEKGKQHDQDILHDVFHKKISLDYKFAEKLNLFDIVSAECFKADGELGDAMIQLCAIADIRFIVARKRYSGKETIEVGFEGCCAGSDYDCHKALITQTIYSI